MYNMLAGRQNIPADLLHSIEILGAAHDGMPPAWAGTEEITVRGNADLIKPNTVILIPSRDCARPDCTALFTPKIYNQEYCIPEICGKMDRPRRRKEKGWS